MAHDPKTIADGPDSFAAHVETQIAWLARLDGAVQNYLGHRVKSGAAQSRLYPLLNDLHDLSNAAAHTTSTVRRLMSEVPKKGGQKIDSGELARSFTSAPLDIRRILDISKEDRDWPAPTATAYAPIRKVKQT